MVPFSVKGGNRLAGPATQSLHPAGMPRQSSLGPAALCDHCGRQCITLEQAGRPCFHCREGTFIHRSGWVFTSCPKCGGGHMYGMCNACNRTGVRAVRRNP
jgi:hypothetical protein